MKKTEGVVANRVFGIFVFFHAFWLTDSG